LLLTFRELLETDRHFAMKSSFDVRDSEVRDCFVFPD